MEHTEGPTVNARTQAKYRWLNKCRADPAKTQHLKDLRKKYYEAHKADEQAKALSAGERQLVANWLGKPVTLESQRERISNPCPAGGPSGGAWQNTPGWSGWSPGLGNTRFQSAQDAKLSAADVPKLKVGMEAYFTTLGTSDRRRYGKLRKEPHKEGLSTIEAAAMLMAQLENDPRIEAALNTTFAHMLDKYRAVYGKQRPEKIAKR